MITVAGIDLAAGRGTTEVALLAAPERPAPPRYLVQAHRPVATDADIVALLHDHAPQVVAIDAPLSLPAAVRAALAGTLLSADAHVYTRAAERDPRWRDIGVRPLPVSFLGGLTLRALVLCARLRAAWPALPLIEVFPTATLRLLAGSAPPPGPLPIGDGEGEISRGADIPVRRSSRGADIPVRQLDPPAEAGSPRKRPAKTTRAARLTARDVLARSIDGIPLDAEPPGADLLDALAAALTALAFLRGDYEALGDADEGQIIVPRVAQCAGYVWARP